MACAPHSIMWPARLAAARRSKSFARLHLLRNFSQLALFAAESKITHKACKQGPRVRAESTQRPVTTIVAPRSKAIAIPLAPT